jgi:hypothetical protein
VVSAGFSTTVLPQASAGASFHAGHEKREIPRDHLPGHADADWGLLAGKGIRNLICPTGVVEEVCRCERDVHIAAFADGFASVHAFYYSEVPCFFL